MANSVVQVTNNVTQHTVEVTAITAAETNLVVTQNTTQHLVELNHNLVVPPGAQALGDHTDVDLATAAPIVGDYIVWDGTFWVPTSVAAVLDPGNLLPGGATDGQILQWDGTSWVPVDPSSTGDDTTDADINVTDTVGNYVPGNVIPAGTDFESIFRAMMESYQEPVVAISDWTTGIFEHGAPYSDDSFTLAFSNDFNIDNTDNGTFVTADTYITGGTGTAFPIDGPYTIPAHAGTLLVTDTSEGNGAIERTGAASITVNGFTNTESGSINTVSASSTVRYRYWIVDNATQLTPDSVSTGQGASLLSGLLTGGGLESDLFSSDSQLGFTASGNHGYIYWVFPAAAEIANVVMNGSINLYAGDKADKTTAVIHMGELDVVNQHGRTVRMEMLRSKVSNAFAAGSVITVS